MKIDSRLSSVLHILLHLAAIPAPKTSETLSKSLRTNSVVVRRIMSGLREHGLVRSEKGHGGGWTIARDPSQISLLHIYEALGRPKILAMGNRADKPACLVEQAVNRNLGAVFEEVQDLLLSRFAEVTLAMLSDDVSVLHGLRSKNFSTEDIRCTERPIR